jgi:hypothetical protein
MCAMMFFPPTNVKHDYQCLRADDKLGVKRTAQLSSPLHTQNTFRVILTATTAYAVLKPALSEVEQVLLVGQTEMFSREWRGYYPVSFFNASRKAWSSNCCRR